MSSYQTKRLGQYSGLTNPRNEDMYNYARAKMALMKAPPRPKAVVRKTKVKYRITRTNPYLMKRLAAASKINKFLYKKLKNPKLIKKMISAKRMINPYKKKTYVPVRMNNPYKNKYTRNYTPYHLAAAAKITKFLKNKIRYPKFYQKMYKNRIPSNPYLKKNLINEHRKRYGLDENLQPYKSKPKPRNNNDYSGYRSSFSSTFYIPKGLKGWR